MIRIDLRSRTPIYEQIIDRIKEQIITGDLQADEQIPSVREMASELAINPNTIGRAYRKLEEEGFIYSVRGRGSFVMKLDAALIRQQKENLYKGIKSLVLEAKKLEITEEDFMDEVHKFYEGGKGNDTCRKS